MCFVQKTLLSFFRGHYANNSIPKRGLGLVNIGGREDVDGLSSCHYGRVCDCDLSVCSGCERAVSGTSAALYLVS